MKDIGLMTRVDKHSFPPKRINNPSVLREEVISGQSQLPEPPGSDQQSFSPSIHQSIRPTDNKAEKKQI
ncbi:MAG: hypothetical protein H7X84_03355 [Verrucomicrobia bacterium]|nr:hypothetical protein [Prolixibacteraceae bacterium]